MCHASKTFIIVDEYNWQNLPNEPGPLTWGEMWVLFLLDAGIDSSPSLFSILPSVSV